MTHPHILHPVAAVFASLLLAGCAGPGVQIAGGGKHGCAVREGALQCWGDNTYGQLGDGSHEEHLSPTPVALDEPARAVTAGIAHSCALVDSGRVVCWGRNSEGRLGEGSHQPSAVPVRVEGLDAVRALSAGFSHTCALTASGEVRCWGQNEHGQLGDGTRQNAARPVRARGLSSAVAITAGGYHTCALLESGQVACWGRNDVGQLGDGTTREDPLSARIVVGLEDAVEVQAGSVHTCALDRAGQVLCWGWNFSGQLGVGDLKNRLEPTPVPLPAPAVSIGAGRSCCPTTGEHSCAALDSGEVWCWGDNLTGQLGRGARGGVEAPAPVVEIASAERVSCGSLFACAVLSDGSVTCWGHNDHGQLGDGTTRPRSRPTRLLLQETP